MTRYQSADPSALDELVRRISPPLLRYFSSNARFDRSEAEDLLQDCWLRIHSSRETYRASEPVMPWIYAIARHTRLDARRKRYRLAAREVLVETVPEVPQREMSPQDDDFDAMISSLPEAQREVLIMLKVSGMSLDEVARAMGSTVGAVKQKARRAYATLRQSLRKD